MRMDNVSCWMNNSSHRTRHPQHLCDRLVSLLTCYCRVQVWNSSLHICADTVTCVYFTGGNKVSADPAGREVYYIGLKSLDCWFESRRGYRCLFLTFVVYCQVEVSTTGRSLVQRCPTYYVYVCVCVCVYIYIHTGCPRRNVSDFGRMFLMLKYTDIIQNTHIQSWTVTEIMAREIW